ncbi:MAG: hypothetical protein KDD69_04160 [Bdellovibrionales bacterium]|nr:hypothetical protein [Bdellovibrionales bacterium]
MKDFSKLMFVMAAVGLLAPLAVVPKTHTPPEAFVAPQAGPSLAQVIKETERSIERLQEELFSDGKVDEAKLLAALQEKYVEALNLGASSAYEVPQLSIVALRARAQLQRCIQIAARVDSFLSVHQQQLDTMKLERIRRFGRGQEEQTTEANEQQGGKR